MERSRLSYKRSYRYDNTHDYDFDPFSRSNRPRFNGGGGGHSSPRFNGMVTTSYRILCHDMKCGGVIGKSGNIIKAIRQHTGARITVHELVDNDEERIIEISDTRRRDPNGRIPDFSPAQEALFLIHERITESKDGEIEGNYGGNGGNGRVVTRLVVSKMHVGSLLGKGGKIVEQIRMETRTYIKVLGRGCTLPRCVSNGEEIVQVVGDISAVKNALAIISSRLKESQHRDRTHFQGRHQDDLGPRTNNSSRHSSLDAAPYGSRLSGSSNDRSRDHSSHQHETTARVENSQTSAKPLVFRLLCPNDKVKSVTCESNGIMDLLQNDIGVNVKVSAPFSVSNERIITISSNEGPEDELFPAQEALLHIQTHIIDTGSDHDNDVMTRLIVGSRHIECLNNNGLLSEMKKLTGADIEIVPRAKLPSFLSNTDELVQIKGDLNSAREALMEVTSRLRSLFYEESFPRRSESGPRNGGPTDKSFTGEPRTAISQNLHSVITGQPSKGAGLFKMNENELREDCASSTPTSLNSSRIQVPLVTRSILEVVIPEFAVTRLLAKSKNKLAQISELSGAKISLMEEDGPNLTEKIIRISGTPEQADKAQSLLQGFFLSIQEDGS